MAIGNLTLALHTAQSGLMATQQALDAVANNISNVNSPGYSRKVVNMQQRVVNGVGAGVEVSDVVRKVDEGLLASLRLELSDLNALSVQSSYYERMQELFGAPGDNLSISHMMEEFISSVESLAVSPNSSLEQSEMARRAQEVTLKLQSMNDTIQELRLQADTQIAEIVSEIEDLTKTIGDLNDKIIRNSAVTNDVSDLKDQRDQALTRLSELVDIRYYYRGDGDVVVFTSAGRTIVDNSQPDISHSQASSMTATATHAEGDINAIYIGEKIATNDVTDEIRSGALKGLIDLRDHILTDLQAEVDELASTMRDTVNQVHNRGTPFPGSQTMNGTRTFLDTSNVANTSEQTFRIDPTSNTDVRFILFDSNGDEQASVALSDLMTDANFGGNANYTGGSGAGGAYAAGDYWQVDEMANVLQRWLSDSALAGGGAVSAAGLGMTGATVALNSDNKLEINLNDTSYYLSIRDESSVSTRGSSNSDATIQFDKDGDGTSDETISGFSNFFGLNDFFVDSVSNSSHESNVVSGTFAATATTLRFTDGTANMPLAAGGYTEITVIAGQSLQDIADTINENVASLEATVVPDGSGYRLRIAHANGANLEITETGGTLLSTLGMHVGNTRVSGSIDIRDDIKTNPSVISRGIAQWDADLGVAGEYQISVADDTIVSQLADQINGNNSFDLAGGQGSLDVSFSSYATSILSRNATLSATNESQVGYQQDLSESLAYKSDTFSGVNLDEEMSQLIILEQSYAAAARVITVINDMFDTLNRVVG